jgi:DNA-binding LacI/PurR family transcriptional regulator
MNKRGITPTIRDVGREAGVSYAAASYVLSGSKHAERISPVAKQRIIEAAAKLGYVRSSVGTALARGYLETVVLLVVSWDMASSHAALTILLTQTAASRGLTTIVYIANDSNEANAFLGTVCSLHPYGLLLLWDSETVSVEQLDHIRSLGIPITDLVPSGPPCTAVVTVDREQAFYLVGRHLVELGHTEIGMVDDFRSLSRTSNLKLAGLRHALAESGLSLDDDLLQQVDGDVFQIGYQGTLDLLARRKDVTAIICLTDKSAFGAISAVQSLGLRVPEDISVSGYSDESESRFFSPSLTTVKGPEPKIANAAIETLIKARSGQAIRHRVQAIGPMELVVRRSTGPVRTWDIEPHAEEP